MTPLRLGPFELEGPVGKGGMAEVWSGRHRDEDVQVAIKLMTAANARDPKYLGSFRNEARLVAGLDHPHVVTLFDFGTVPDEVAADSGGRLAGGSPYLVMEWASDGTLSSAPPSSWGELRATLKTLLDALAHAHAHGVLHRDIKPANVLRCGRVDLRPGIKLADFGIAHRDDRPDEDTGFISGTIGYLAPEQISKDHEEGAWTDLYGLGCLAFQLLTGSLPFTGSKEDVIEGHLFRMFEPLPPRFHAPGAIWPWLSRLLAKHPAFRFRCAADAAFALPPDESPGASTPARSDDADLGRRVHEDTGELTRDAITVDAPTSIGEVRASATTPLLPEREPLFDPAPPMPISYEAEYARARSLHLHGAGLGLYGLRTIPLVDRDAERDRLWTLLREVREQGRLRVALVEGPSGFGKSRLAEWLCERASELGIAQPLRATHSEGGSAVDGLGPMLERHFRCAGRRKRETTARVLEALAALGCRDTDEAQALVEIVAPAERDGDRPVPFANARERHEVVRRHLERLGRARPVIVWLDDVQWGDDALSFASYLLDSTDKGPLPVVVLATIRVEALVERRLEAELVAQLHDRVEVERIEVGPLPSEHRFALVGELLGLEGEVAARVEQRAAGNPLFAIQLVGDWVQRGALVPARGGFAVRKGATVELPDDLHHVWAQRIELLLDGRPAGEDSALELAAVLGQEVDTDEWAAACAIANVPASSHLVEALLDARLARARRDGVERWAFVHGMVRESLARRAGAAGRLVGHHRTCAALLLDRRGRGVSERLGRHLVAAGELALALGPILDGAEQRCRAGEPRAAIALIVEREDTLRRMGVGPDDERFAEGWVLRSEAERLRGKLDDADRFGAMAEDAERANGRTRVLATALLKRAYARELRGSFDEAEALAQEAAEHYAASSDEQGTASAERFLGVLCAHRGEWERGTALMERAAASQERIGDEQGLAGTLVMLSDLLGRSARWTRAREVAERALVVYKRLASRLGTANAHNALGEIGRALGDLDAAEAHYRTALGIFEAIGSVNVTVAQLNLGLTLLERKKLGQARHALEESRRMLARTGWRAALACACAGLLPCAAASRDWPAWDSHLETVRSTLADVVDHVLNRDLAWALTLGAELATSAGDGERARAAYELALDQWRLLGRDAEAAKIEETLG